MGEPQSDATTRIANQLTKQTEAWASALPGFLSALQAQTAATKDLVSKLDTRLEAALEHQRNTLASFRGIQEALKAIATHVTAAPPPPPTSGV